MPRAISLWGQLQSLVQAAPMTAATTLRDVLATEDLARRTRRAPNLTSQNEALHDLARSLHTPETALDCLLATALEQTDAESVGISLLEAQPDGSVLFRWVAMAGAYANYKGGSTPRNHSPCGYTLDEGTPQLFFWPGRYFESLAHAEPPLTEGLVVPFHHGTEPWGTIWVASHDEKQQDRFDMEDVRIMRSFAGFAAGILRMLGYPRPSGSK